MHFVPFGFIIFRCFHQSWCVHLHGNCSTTCFVCNGVLWPIMIHAQNGRSSVIRLENFFQWVLVLGLNPLYFWSCLSTIYQSIHLSIYPSIHLSVHLSFYLYILSIFQSTYLCVYLSYVFLSGLILSCLILSYLILTDLTLPYLTWSYLTLPYLS